MTRLLLFLLVLAAVLGAAAGIGRAVGPIERAVSEEEAHAEDAGATEEHESAAEPVGLSLAANGFRFVPERTRLATGRSELVFRIVGARRYDVVHERRMHLIVVSRDLEVFRHVHPELRADGTWAVELDLPEPGVYRAFADFSAAGKRTVLGVDLFVTGALQRQPEGRRPEARLVGSGHGMLRFQVGETLPYLGARGHLVVLREGDLAYVHAHPEADELAFEVELPTPGRYRAFLQWRNADGIRTADFPLERR